MQELRFFDFWSNAPLKNWFADNLTPQSTTRATAAIASNTWGGGEPIVRSRMDFRVYILCQQESCKVLIIQKTQMDYCEGQARSCEYFNFLGHLS